MMATARNFVDQVIRDFALVKRDSNSAYADERTRRESALDKTIADSFPASDPPSSIPDPLGDAP